MKITISHSCRLLNLIPMAKVFLLWCIVALMVTVSRAQIQIAPTEDFYRAALAELDQSERAALEMGLPASIDVSRARLEVPRSYKSKRPLPDIYAIDWPRYFEPLVRGDKAAEIVIMRVETLADLLADTGIDKEYFVVTIEWKKSGQAEDAAKGKAAGPRFKSRSDRTKNPESIRSANIAFYAAFLKAMAQIAVQVQAEAPPTSAAPNEPRPKKGRQPSQRRQVGVTLNPRTVSRG